MPYILPTLPFAANTFEGLLSEETIEAHYALHERYFEKLNKLVQGSSFAHLPLETIIKDAPEDSELGFVAAQAWNHSFLWQSMTPYGDDIDPSTGFGRAVQAYGSTASFEQLVVAQAVSLLRPGWVWVVATPQGEIKIWAAEGARNPLRYSHTPLLVMDMWEHAYYLDYVIDKQRFAQTCVDNILNWKFAEANYRRAFGV